MDKVIIYNPRNGAEINDIFAQRTWKHEVNTIKKYPQELADYLLSKYDFLQRVLPRDLKDIKKIMAAKYACDYPGCDYITDSKKKLRMHKMGKHKLTKEKIKELEEIEDAKPSGNVKVKSRKLSPEEQAGVPNTKKGEVDNWYGPGLEGDKIGSGMMKASIPGETPGHFGGNQ